MSDIACFTGCGCTGNVSLDFEYVCTDSREADKDSLGFRYQFAYDGMEIEL